jgi:hypothetical protein
MEQEIFKKVLPRRYLLIEIMQSHPPSQFEAQQPPGTSSRFACEKRSNFLLVQNLTQDNERGNQPLSLSLNSSRRFKTANQLLIYMAHLV